MGTFDLTSLSEPTDEQLLALMEGIGEIGRASSAKTQSIMEQMLQEAIA